MEAFLHDLRLAARGLWRDRGFTAAAVVILTLALSLHVTVYGVMDAILFRGYPLVQHNERLVYLQERGPSNQCCMSYPDFEDWRAQARAFDGLGFVRGVPITFRDGDGRPMDMRATALSVNTFSVLGVAPVLGRDFMPADAAPGAAPVAILNHRFWERRFNRRQDVVGATVHINGAAATVIGVMPERFDFPLKVDDDLWLPLVVRPELLQRGLTPGGFTVVGRLRDGVTIAEARSELETINRRLEAAYPATNRGLVPTVATHAHMNSGPDAALIWGSLWAGAWLVLVIACANLANLALVRTIGRWREYSTRIALGGGVGRLIRGIVLESAVLTAAAAAIAWSIAVWSLRMWDAVTASQYQVLDYSTNGWTVAYLVAVAAGVVLLISVAPITKVRQIGVQGAFEHNTRGVTRSVRARRLAAGLVAVQMALAIVLLSGAGVLLRSFTTIVSAESGVPLPENVMIGLTRLPSDAYPTALSQAEYFARLDAAVRTVAGVDHVTVASTTPVRFATLRPLELDGQPSPPEGEPRVGFIRVGPEYFHVIGVSPVVGRSFERSDGMASAPVAIVNESFAERFWPGESALGKRLRSTDRNASGEWRTVVGVVRNIMQGDPLRQQFRPLVYLPFAQEPPPRQAYFLARTSVPSAQVGGAVRARVQGIDADVQLENFGTLAASFAFDRDFMDAEHSELGKYSKVAPIFAAIALVLSAIGLGAVLAHAVSQRTKEIGVRMAIGAAAPDIRRLIVTDGMRPVGLGLIAGLAASLAVNRLLQSQLVGVSPYDPLTLATAPLLLLLIAVLACRAPARRAVRVDPVVALRHE